MSTNPPQHEAMAIHRNEFATLAEAMAAVALFPRCGQCKGELKLGQVAGRWMLLCMKRPAAHSSIRKVKYVGEK